MAYKDLIVAIFGKPRTVISEDDFIALLPELLAPWPKPVTGSKATKENGELAIVMRFGLGLEREHTLKDVAQKLGFVSVDGVRGLECRAFKALREPLNVARYTFE